MEYKKNVNIQFNLKRLNFNKYAVIFYLVTCVSVYRIMEYRSAVKTLKTLNNCMIYVLIIITIIHYGTT